MSHTNLQPDLIDLRSDTVTRPTPEMYEAIAAAPLGDDVLGDDPTVNKLERLAAEMVKKDAALFVPTGTMGNQIALACHCKPGEGILIEQDAHIIYYEVGSPALIASVVSWTLPSHRGAIDPDMVDARILTQTLHTPGTALLCLENTHNRAGGAVIPQANMRRYREIADRRGIKVHLDGARVFNASVALGVPVSEITQHVDTVNFCLSKGLRSPVGSLLCGSYEFIDKARFWRKRLGGGMRQAGILAACGIVSLTQMVDRLAEDHQNAKRLAKAIDSFPGLEVDLNSVETNMVLMQTPGPSTEWQSLLEERKLLCLPTAKDQLRLVLHADITLDMTDTAIEIIGLLAKEQARIPVR